MYMHKSMALLQLIVHNHQQAGAGCNNLGLGKEVIANVEL